ncbi:MAG: hypothetical protein ACKVHB_08185 [Pseudomonadales bacterium]|jgi:hypothetical protein
MSRPSELIASPNGHSRSPYQSQWRLQAAWTKEKLRNIYQISLAAHLAQADFDQSAPTRRQTHQLFFDPYY